MGFLLLGIAGCVWFVLWALLVYEDPDSHPFISQKEYDYIVKGQGIEKSSGVSMNKATGIGVGRDIFGICLA